MRKSASRSALTVRSLLVVGGLGVLLAAWNVYTVGRDTAIATGPESSTQRSFFVNAADRPDIATFFRKLKSRQRVEMARNIGRYQDPVMAKLCGILLADFDPAARRALSDSLAAIARVRPDAVASQLSQTDSLQYLGVSRALRAAGRSALPSVARELADPAARKNAIAYLVSYGGDAAGKVRPYLLAPDKDTREAAEDAAGEMRDREAVPKLLAIFRSSDPVERRIAFGAVASIGSPETEGLMAAVLADKSEPVSMRSLAAFGLGRIATPPAAAALWAFAHDHDSTVQEQVVNALVSCGAVALDSPSTLKGIRLTVAAHTAGPVADRVILADLEDPDLAVAAIRAASGRPTLARPVAAVLGRPSEASNGDIAEAAVDTLGSTNEGKSLLQGFKDNPDVAGFIARRDRLSP